MFTMNLATFVFFGVEKNDKHFVFFMTSAHVSHAPLGSGSKIVTSDDMEL